MDARRGVTPLFPYERPRINGWPTLLLYTTHTATALNASHTTIVTPAAACHDLSHDVDQPLQPFCLSVILSPRLSAMPCVLLRMRM